MTTDNSEGTFWFTNGPLPEQFLRCAYLTMDQKEWALPKPEALKYIEWCQDKGFQVLGFEVWGPTVPGPTISVPGPNGSDVIYTFSGNAEECRQRIEQNDFGYIKGALGVDAVFNIEVESKGTSTHN